MSALDNAWDFITTLLTDNVKYPGIDYNYCHLIPVDSLKILSESGLADVLYEWLLDEAKHKIGHNISPKFWNNFQVSISENEAVDHVPRCFFELYSGVTYVITWFKKLRALQTYLRLPTSDEDAEEDFLNAINATLKGIVFCNVNNHFKQAFSKYLKRSLGAFDVTLNNDKIENSECHCGFQVQECICEHIFCRFKELFNQLKHLKVLEVVIAEPIMQYIHEKIYLHIELECMGDFEKCYIDSLNYWMQNNIVKWMDKLFETCFGSNDTSIKLLPSHIKRLKFYTSEVYGRLRIEQLFSIIIDFPDSLPVLQDLVVCLNMVPELKPVLVKSLKEALQMRLLQPGVNTGDILTAYISTMRALRVLDQSGVLLEMVGEPVKEYLRGRDDTVRCIVSSLTEDSNNELAEELNKGRLLSDNDSGDESSILHNWEFWEPDPVEAEPLKPSQASRCFDIISMLINIYGSKELFIDEYRSLLADRILIQLSYDTEREIRHLELLKLRFGESQLHQCEVMLKDVFDSRRINAQVAESKEGSESSVVPVNAMILSAQFWPQGLKDENVKLPNCFVEALDNYKSSFELLKGNRTLYWKPHLGSIEIELELNGKSHEFKVSPIHAAIIWHFQSKSSYTLDELSLLLEMPAQALQRKISFWQSQGVLREDGNDTYVLTDELKISHQEPMAVEDEDPESVLVSAQDQKTEEIQIIWSYVAGMLTNLESLTLERIHSMLKMFAMQGPGSQCTILELKNILETKIKELKLVYSNGLYRLN